MPRCRYGRTLGGTDTWLTLVSCGHVKRLGPPPSHRRSGSCPPGLTGSSRHDMRRQRCLPPWAATMSVRESSSAEHREARRRPVAAAHIPLPLHLYIDRALPAVHLLLATVLRSCVDDRQPISPEAPVTEPGGRRMSLSVSADHGTCFRRLALARQRDRSLWRRAGSGLADHR